MKISVIITNDNFMYEYKDEEGLRYKLYKCPHCGTGIKDFETECFVCDAVVTWNITKGD